MEESLHEGASVGRFVVLDSELVNEELLVDVVVHELVVEAAQPQLLELLSADLFHLSLVSLHTLSILFDTLKECTEVSEVLAVVLEVGVKVLIEAEWVRVICCLLVYFLEVQRGG